MECKSALLTREVRTEQLHLGVQLKTAACKRIGDSSGSGTRSPLRSNSPAELELFKAIRMNDLKKVKDIINSKEVDLNTRHSLGWTFLQSAAVRGAHEIVQVLLEAGADPDAIDEFSNAAQISFEKKLNYVAVFMLREEEFADFLSGNVSFLGSTALHYAALADSPETIRVLMAHHANPNLENEFGHKAFDYIKDSQDPAMVQLIPEFTKYAMEYEDYIKQQQLESRRKFPLEQRIREVIIGQEGAITTVAAAIRRKENGWTDTEHPLVFLFLGSSGIGKTELAKQVANYLHGDKPSTLSKLKGSSKPEGNKSFIRIDMSEYQAKHEVSKFIGSPPGYVGHEEGGQLTKALTENPNAVVLFDEIEKAHPDVLTIMLQLFDEGRLTDGKGRTIVCKDAIFIMTSNLASDEIADYGIKLRRESEELTKAHYSGKIINEQETDKVVVSRYFKDNVIRPILKRHFKRDEFLGRINEIVYFLPFSRSELHKLVTRELELWKERAAIRHRISLSWDRNVIGVLANGYDVHYGARSIKYEVDRRVVNKLASAHENRLMLPGAKVHVVVSEDGEEFTFAKVEPTPLQEATET
ncbi:PREDICTED: caseinolytic peptidase B protein homolog, partial [Rhagoletis zephyria]|uniref:caseinolytic peptidase B protein homolog n=1 Tax=Rhagoletis zephyria TaxID=28612 RepID=UPI000811615E